MSSPNPANPSALVPMTPEPALTPMDIALSGTVPQYLTTMPSESVADKRLLYQALNGEHIPFKDVVNVPMKLLGYVIRPSQEKLSQQGELFRFPVIVLITDDGRMIRAGSTGVAQCCLQLQQIYGNGPWNPPVDVIPRLRDIGNSQSWGTLEMPIEPSPKGKKS